MSYRKDPLTLSDEDFIVMESWWENLDLHRGDRAQLKRSRTPDEVLTQEAFANFVAYKTDLKTEEGKLVPRSLSKNWRNPDHFYAAALVCGVLCRVKVSSHQSSLLDKEKSKEASFAEQLARSKKSSDQPIMSKMRFQRLQQSRTIEEFFLNMCRAIDLLSGEVNLRSLIEDTLQWYREFFFGKNKSPTKRISVRWATDYFLTLNH